MFYLCLFNLILLTSCTQDVSLKNITLNFDEKHEVLIDTMNIIKLETTENSLLYDIGHIEYVDDKYFVYSRNLVRVFDMQGHFLFNLSQKGEGPNEYFSLHNITSDSKCIFLYDFNASRILCFDFEGNYLSDIKLNCDIDQVHPAKVFYLNENTFLTYNSYAGDEMGVPVLSLWNNTLDKQKYIGGRTLQSGLRFADGCYVSEDKRILYWEPAKDTLFQVINNILSPLYKIDFGKHAMPGEIAKKDDYERIMFLGRKENFKYASLARYYQRKDDVLYFSCIYNGVVYICSYNEVNGNVGVYSFYDVNNHYKACPFYKIVDDYIILELKDNRNEENNHVLYKFPIDHLK